MTDLNKFTDWSKLEGMLKQQADSTEGRKIDEAALIEHLKSRVKGQDAVVADLAKLLRLQMGRKNASRPLANLLFLGPTGTGKTELAKVLAEYLYGNEKAMVRFDCSELNGEHAKSRLIGVPLGYVGSEAGGELTRAVLANPRRLILFDEIEKAYHGVFDLFLQMMGDGRLTEQGSGQTADFSQSVIILTSNAESERIARIKADCPDYLEMVNAIKGHLADAKVFRPEIVGRIDKVYVFDRLSGLVVAEVAIMKIEKLAKSYGLKIEFVAPELIMKALAANDKVSRFGIRELERVVFDQFADPLSRARDAGATSVRFNVDQAGNVVVQ